MTDYKLETTYHPHWCDVETVKAGLSTHTYQHIGAHAMKPVACFIRDNNAVQIGGAYGWIQFGWLFIDLL